MKIFTTKHKLLLLLFSFILMNGCSTKERVNDYEVVSDNRAAEIDDGSIDPQYTTELQPDPDAFLAKDWVQPEPKITYKYMDDPKFYTEDELPENKYRKGNVIIKLPAGADKSLLNSIR